MMQLLAGLGPRIANLSEWKDGHKCALASLLTLPFVAVWIVRLALVERDPALAPYLDPDAVGPMLDFVWFQAVGHLSIIVLGALAGRRTQHSPLLVNVAIQFWFVCYFLDIYAIGPFSSPFVLLLLLFPVLGFIMFERRPVALGLASFAVLLTASTVLERMAWLPYAPLIGASPFVDGRPYTSWVLSLGAIPLLASALILAIFAFVVAEWRDREEQLKALCKTDYLTGVHNRRSFMELAELEFSRARRYGSALSIVMVDVDYFKRVNDSYGHGVGDEVLKLVAGVLAAELRRHDIVARYGGEEFALLLAETPAEPARVLAERCRRRIEAAVLKAAAVTVRVTASVGIAAYPRPGVERVSQLIDRADEALYQAKEAGRNRVALAA
jgi:diguanylate cyclase (GGDEF)-like protein